MKSSCKGEIMYIINKKKKEQKYVVHAKNTIEIQRRENIQRLPMFREDLT